MDQKASVIFFPPHISCMSFAYSFNPVLGYLLVILLSFFLPFLSPYSVRYWKIESKRRHPFLAE